MSPKIKSKQLVTVSPSSEAEVNDIVLCKVRGNYYLHLVKAIGKRGYLIGNNKGFDNGWTKTIFGRVIKVEN